MIYLYYGEEPETSRPVYLPIDVGDSGTECGVLIRNFVSNSLSETRHWKENDVVHFHIEYTKPNSSIDSSWQSAGTSYKWFSNSTYYEWSLGSGGWVYNATHITGIVTRYHGTFLSVEPDTCLKTSVAYYYYRPSDGYTESRIETWSAYTLYAMWGGINHLLLRSYWPDRHTEPLPGISEDEKNHIVHSVTRELSDRLEQTPPPSEVFRGAANSIGNNMNSIANLVEGVDFVKDLLSFKVTDLIKDMKHWSPKKIKKALSSGWMGYRYSYSTTKADIKGMTDYLLSYVDPNNFTDLKRHASASNAFGTTRCKVVFSSGDPINNTLRQLETTGMMLNAYAVWDMVPLSFVVDWFLPIGDFLEDLSSNWVSQPSVFSFSDIVFSRKTRIDDVSRGIHAKAYQRWYSKDVPPFETYSSSPSSKTVVKRVFDGLALTVK